MPPGAASGATPFAKSNTLDTQRFSSLIITWDPGPAQRAARTPRQDLAPIAAMAAAAAFSQTLRIGCRVFCIDYHVPSVLAKEAATLDLLSDGRLEMGIGAGWSEVEYTAMGLEFDRPGRRIAKLAEVVSLIKAHWARRRTGLLGRLCSGARIRGKTTPGAAAASADHDRRGRSRACCRSPAAKPTSSVFQRAFPSARRRRS